jgi:hypothetical protein
MTDVSVTDKGNPAGKPPQEFDLIVNKALKKWPSQFITGMEIKGLAGSPGAPRPRRRSSGCGQSKGRFGQEGTAAGRKEIHYS